MPQLNNIHSFEGPNASLISTSSADHLCEPEGSGGGGGRVRFVNSTVRYHIGSGPAHALWTGRSRLEQVLMVAVAGLILISSILLIVIGKTQEDTTCGRPINDSNSNNSSVNDVLLMKCSSSGQVRIISHQAGIA